MKTFSITFEHVQPPSRRIHILSVPGVFQGGELELQSPGVRGLNAASRSRPKEPLQPLVPKAHYHLGNVKCRFTLVNEPAGKRVSVESEVGKAVCLR